MKLRLRTPPNQNKSIVWRAATNGGMFDIAELTDALPELVSPAIFAIMANRVRIGRRHYEQAR